MFGKTNRALAQAALVGAILAAPLPSLAAETVHLYLKADGQDIQGESTQTSLGRENSIECVAFHLQPSAARSVLTCKKRIDKASPLLLKAMVQQQNVSFIFKFFRPNPAGDGTTEQYYTIDSKLGRLVSVEQAVPDATEPTTSSLPPLESLTFTTGDLCVTITSGGVVQCF